VRWIALGAKVKPLMGEVSVTIAWFRPARRGDLDNIQKILLDSLQGVAYLDDSQVGAICAFRHEDKANPRCVVTVDPLP
jgi:Holliday junction resolvase RusA-like endonuclease